MIENFKIYWQKYPLRSLLIIGFIVRLVAILFSPGYAMHDDHFLIIEPAVSWTKGQDYNSWLPWSQNTDNPVPSGHSFFYPGLHYLFFSVTKWLHITDPKIQMLLIRFIHGVFSLCTIYSAFRITDKIATRRAAIIVGIAIAIGWAFPFYSVRNLVEMVCIPFYLYGLWLIVKSDFKDGWKAFLLAGILFGIAFSVRLQLAVFYLGFGLCLLIMKKWKGSISLIIGFGIGAFLSQGIIDYFIWGKPFAELIEYINYNNSDAMYDYGGRWNWYKYIMVLTFFSIPILGVFWLVGNVLSARKYFWLSVPLILFLLFHTMYPNQQERFIFPILPLFIILGVAGWEAFREKSRFWNKRAGLWSGISKTAWTINIIILIGAATYATKTAKVNAAYHFYELSSDQTINILQEDSFGKDEWYLGDATAFPRFYAGDKKIVTFEINTPADRRKWEENQRKADYVLLHGKSYLDERLSFFKKYYPDMETVTTYQSSPVDRFLHYMNPRNRNAQVIIIKTNG